MIARHERTIGLQETTLDDMIRSGVEPPIHPTPEKPKEVNMDYCRCGAKSYLKEGETMERCSREWCREYIFNCSCPRGVPDGR